MNNAEILSQLKDVHWPNQPSLWPPDLGFMAIFFLGLMIVSLFLWFLMGWKKRLLKKAIRKELGLIEAQFNERGDVSLLQAQLSALLRRMWKAKHKGSSQTIEINRLGKPLAALLPKSKETQKLIQLLEQDRFKKDPAVDGSALLFLARRQINRCRI